MLANLGEQVPARQGLIVYQRDIGASFGRGDGCCGRGRRRRKGLKGLRLTLLTPPSVSTTCNREGVCDKAAVYVTVGNYDVF